MISCEHASYLSSKKQHEKLTIWEHISLRMHHVMCVFCKMYEKELQLISHKIAEYLKIEKKDMHPQVKIPEQRKQKMTEMVNENLKPINR
jgi:hypothetical protein